MYDMICACSHLSYEREARSRALDHLLLGSLPGVTSYRTKASKDHLLDQR